MAIIQQFFTPVINKFGFQGLSTAGQERSAVPRQELFYVVEEEEIDPQAAPDGVQVFMNCSLPFGFSYAITDITMSIFHDIQDDWKTAAICTVRDDNLPDNRTYLTHYDAESAGTVQFPGGSPPNLDRVLQAWTWKKFPSWIIIPQENSVAHITLTTSTEDNDPGGFEGGTFNALVRVLQYDVAQAHHFEVNTPLLIR